ncbi:MAG: hypothetical protein NDI60_06405 [Elusimicrobiales bacterium]|nr:hypothetical protein [Elusimicrobiales bacterium]
MMKPFVATILASCAFLLGACSHAPVPGSSKAPPAQLSADGSAPFNEKDLAASRAAAVLDAQRSAVSRAAVLYLDEETRAEKSSVLENYLLKTPQHYVAKYKIVSEGQDGAFYRVRLKAWVYNGRIASELRALKLSGVSAAAPRAAFVLRGAPAPAFVSAFRETFVRRSAAVIEDFPFAADAALAAGPEEKLLEAAAVSGADLLISASASAAAAGAGLNTGFYPSRADASVRLYDAVSGKLLLDFSGQGSGIDSTEAGSFSKSLASAGELLAQEAAVRAARAFKPETPLRIKFYGLEGLEIVETLRAQLLRLDARGVRLDSFDSGTAVFLAVPRKPDPQEFASSVLRGDALGLEMEGTSPQEIAFSLPR